MEGLRRWAKEQKECCESTITDISTQIRNVTAFIDKICKTKDTIQSAFLGLPATTKDIKRKRKHAAKETTSKCRHCKCQRAEGAAEELVNALTSGKEHFQEGLLLADTDVN